MFMLKEKQKDGRNIDAHTQKISILFGNIFVFLCKLTPPETPLGLFSCSKHPSDIFYQSQIGCFCNVYKSVYSTSPCSRLCGVFVPVTEKNVWICGKDKLFFSTAPVDGENMRCEELLKETQMESSEGDSNFTQLEHETDLMAEKALIEVRKPPTDIVQDILHREQVSGPFIINPGCLLTYSSFLWVNKILNTVRPVQPSKVYFT